MIQSEKLLGTKTYTLTVTTDPSSATCTLTYDGVSHSTKSAEVKAGTVISYSIYHSTYGTTTGSITIDKDKTLSCNGTYSINNTATSWTQPILTSNTSSSELTLSGNQVSNSPLWHAFDDTQEAGINKRGWCPVALSNPAGKYGLFQTSKAIKVSKVTITNRQYNNRCFLKITWSWGNSSSTTSGSYSYTNSVTAANSSWSFSPNEQTYSKYHKLTIDSGSYDTSQLSCGCNEIEITAKYLTTSYTYYWNKTIS